MKKLFLIITSVISFFLGSLGAPTGYPMVSATQIVYAGEKPQIIASFETSKFFKKQKLVRKNSRNLKTGERAYDYSFKDSENPDTSFGVEFFCIGQEVRGISIMWVGESKFQPAQITAKKAEQITDLALFWGIPEQSTQIIDYAKSQQSIRYTGGSGQAPRTVLGPITVYCGVTGSGLWLGWQKS